MDETMARHVAEAASALRIILLAESGDLAGLPCPPGAARTAAIDSRAAPSNRPQPAADTRRAPDPLRETRPPVARQPSANPPQHQIAIPQPSPEFPGGLEELASRVRSCTLCSLHESRTNTVFGEGCITTPQVMFVGEGPGADEDLTGRPFVGASGQLLDRMIVAMGLRREDCYIANVVKCRPPHDATPLPNQAGACMPFLRAQISMIKPQFLVALGASAANAITGSQDGVARLRGRIHRYGDIPMVVTYHPAALLRNADYKRPTWTDLQMVMARLRSE